MSGTENAPAGPGSSLGGGSLAGLRQRRLELAERVASLTWDLGGLTYEMAIRDHYRLDVLARRAAELQQADGELGEIERLLASAEAAIDGQCSSCGAVHSRGAAYCWHCGAALIAEARPAVLQSIQASSNGNHVPADTAQVGENSERAHAVPTAADVSGSA
ncbi:MAG TPA: hypothetical protein VID48_15615 [Solirubrobacteraceae bacterium]|jgi:hypothetical protein